MTWPTCLFNGKVLKNIQIRVWKSNTVFMDKAVFRKKIRGVVLWPAGERRLRYPEVRKGNKNGYGSS
jgi:hypothetical protein